MTDCFALLDDHQATPDQARSRLYQQHRQTLVCRHAEDFPAMLAQMQQALANGLHAVALWHYELGAALQGLPYLGDHDDTQPLARVLLFAHCQHLGREQVDQWLAQQDELDKDRQACGIANLRPSVDQATFHDAIGRIRDYIGAGDTYQVNYTYRLHFEVYGTALALYRKLRARQPVPYGALVQDEHGTAVLSFSPELFVAHTGGQLRTQPMKGTARAAPDALAEAGAINAALAQALANDEKNRAENLMIVDLLRNDLGRIAANGSVTVPQLFEVRRYGQVLQMTSTIHAQLRADVTLAQAMAALYPCGSITGAPKRRTMEIIHELEDTPRGLYTGAIGWFDAPRSGQAVGDFCLSVPIRTLSLQPRGLEMTGMVGTMGVGAGIVHDSDAASEYAECMLKAAFLTGLGHDFALFETLRAQRAGCAHQARHLARLQASAHTFGIAFDLAALEARLAAACAALPDDGPYRLRLALDTQGAVSITHAPLPSLPAGPVKVFLAAQATNSVDLLLRHKSTRRAAYDAAWQQAERNGGFDKLFFNEHDCLTEGGRSNVFVKIDGRWVTPPLSAGVLPGVMRAVLLADPAWDAREESINRAQLLAADELVLCNSLRGVLPAQLVLD